MKIRIQLSKILVYALMIVVGFAGVKLASIIIQRYTVEVNGILGLVLIYLIYRVYLSSRRLEIDEPTEVLFEFPTNVRYFVFGFFWSLILSWALGHVFDMIQVSFKR